MALVMGTVAAGGMEGRVGGSSVGVSSSNMRCTAPYRHVSASGEDL
jgi:hypothetical protein